MGRFIQYSIRVADQSVRAELATFSEKPIPTGVHFGGLTQILNPLPVWTVEVAA
jgi:hypothetical protein